VSDGADVVGGLVVGEGEGTVVLLLEPLVVVLVEPPVEPAVGPLPAPSEEGLAVLLPVCVAAAVDRPGS
jgi:hypothetical protein